MRQIATFVCIAAWVGVALGTAVAVAEPANGASLEIAAALDRKVDLDRGRESYQSCAVCHGVDAAGRSDGTFPQLAGQHASVIIKQLADIRSGRRDNPIMQPFAQQLIDAQQIADVAGYLAARPRSRANGKGPGTDLATGERLYRRDCQRCHGPDGEGNAGRFIPALASQHYQYMLRQVRDIGAGRRGNSHPEMAVLVERLNDAELRALVDYAARLNTRPLDTPRRSTP